MRDTPECKECVGKCVESPLCMKLQEGRCECLTIEDIKELLDQTDWSDEDKGEVMSYYILKEMDEAGD